MPHTTKPDATPSCLHIFTNHPPPPLFSTSSQRYQSHPWPHYIDQSSWHKASSVLAKQSSHVKPTLEPLPLPPNPAHPEWRSRCYNCLQFGHDQTKCTSDKRVCTVCWQEGHGAKVCPKSVLKSTFDLLVPRGNMGDAKLPLNRPKLAMVFIPETHTIKQNSNWDLMWQLFYLVSCDLAIERLCTGPWKKNILSFSLVSSR